MAWNFCVGTVVQQFYQSEVNNEYVIRGNSAVLKCSIPSFVADFVNVVSWHDEDEVQLGLGVADGEKKNEMKPGSKRYLTFPHFITIRSLHPVRRINPFVLLSASCQSVLRSGSGVRVCDQGKYCGSQVHHSQFCGRFRESRSVGFRRGSGVPSG